LSGGYFRLAIFGETVIQKFGYQIMDGPVEFECQPFELAPHLAREMGRYPAWCTDPPVVEGMSLT
jgi:hypothetical protein